MSAVVKGGLIRRMVERVFARPETSTPRWSANKILNIVCGTTIAWMLLWMGVSHYWRLGVEMQSQGCLPWRYFVLTTHAPTTIERNQTYQYQSEGAPLMPDGMRIVKYVAGLPGDHVVVNASGISINGKFWGPVSAETLRKGHMTIAQVTKNYIVPPGKLVVLGTTSVTWDSRYWGPINRMQVNARAYHLW